MSASHRFLAVLSALACLHPLNATDLVVTTGTTTVITDNSSAGNDGFGNLGHLNGAPLFSGGTFIESGATLQLGNGQSRVHTVYEVSITNAPANTFALLGAGEVVNNGSLLLNQQVVRFAQTSLNPDEPYFSEWWDNVDFRLVLANVISGSGTVGQTGGLTLLTGANTYTGTTTISGGRLALGDAGRLGSGALVITGGTLDLGGTTATTVSSLTGTGGQITGNGTLHIDVATGATFSGQVNSASIEKLGTGTLTLAGSTDNASGSATVSTGVLELAKTSTSSVHAIGGTLVIAGGATARLAGTGNDQIYDGASVMAQAGGTLDLNGRNETVGALSGDGTVTTLAAGAVTFGIARGSSFGGVLADGAGTLALVKSGTDTLTLTGANTYTGGTTLAGGTLVLGSAGALGGSGTISFADGALQWTSANATDYSARFSTAAGQAYVFDTNSQSVTLASNLASAGGTFDKRGAGMLTLTGANSFSGLTLTGGTLALGSTNALGNSGTITFAGGVLQWTSANATDYSARFSTAANQTFGLDTNGRDVAFASALASSGGSLTKLGAGTLTLAGSNALAGGTTVGAGTLALASGGSLATSALTVNSGAILRTNGQGTTAGTLAGSGTIYSGGNVNVNGTASATFSGTLDQVSIVKSGTGTLTLAGDIDNNSTYATVTGGTLVLAKDSSASVHSLGTAQAHFVASGGTLRLGGTGGDQIYDSGTVNLESGGTFDLNTRSETIAGGATLAGNVLIDLGSAGGRSAEQAALTVTGATTLGGALSLNLASGFALETTYQLFDFTSTTGTWATVSLTGSVNASLTFSGNLWTWVDGDNTYAFNQMTGEFAAGEEPFIDVLTISRLRTLSSPSTLGSTGTITFAGGTLQWTAANTTDYSARFSTADNQAFNLDTNGQHITLASTLASTGGTLTKLGDGTLTLTGINTYTGGTTISAGTLEVASAAALGSGPVVNNASLAVTAPGSLVFDKPIAGTGSLSLNVDGTVALTGASTYTGGTYLNGGTVSLASAGALGNTDRIYFNGGTLQWTAANTGDYSGLMQVYDNTQIMRDEAFRFDTNGQDITLGASIYPGSSGSITKLGAGTLTLAGYLNYGGTATVEEGILRLAHSNTGQIYGGITIQAGATLDIASGFYITTSLTGLGRLTGDVNGAFGVGYSNTDGSFSGSIDTLFLLKTGSGTFTLGGSTDNASVSITVDGGTLVLAKESSATVHAVGQNIYATNSTLRLAGTGDDQLYDQIIVRLTSATFDLNGRNETFRGLDGTDGEVTNTAAGTTSVLTLRGNDYISIFSGGIHDGAGVVALVKDGASYLKLQGANSYTGSTLINGGQLIVDEGASLTGTSSLVFDNGGWMTVGKTAVVTVGALSGSADTIILGGYWQNESQTPADFGRITVTDAADSTFAGTLYNLTLNKTGAGTLTLGGNDGNGNLWVNVTGGTLVLDKDGASSIYDSSALGSGVQRFGSGTTLRLAGTGGNQISGWAMVDLAAGATFDLNGRSEHTGWLTGDGSVTNTAAGTLSTLSIGHWESDDTTAASIADGAGRVALAKLSDNTLTLTGASTYTGGTTVTTGTLSLGNGGATGSITGPVTIADGANLTFNRSNAVTFSGVISGAGSVTKLGAGSLTLDGLNTYSGATAVNAGTLLFNGSAESSAFTVAAGATLGGSGRVGTVNLLAGGTLSPGNSPGVLTIGSGSSFAGTVRLEIAGTQRGVSYGAIDVSGAGQLTLGGNLDLVFTTSLGAAASYHLLDFTAGTGAWSAVSVGGLYEGNLLSSAGLWTGEISGYAFSFDEATGILSTISLAAVPEPANAAILAGIVMLAWTSRRRRRNPRA